MPAAAVHPRQASLDFSAPPPVAVTPRRTKAAIYDAGAATRRTIGWYAPTISPNAAALQSLGVLRDRARLAVRNDGYAAGTIDKLVTNIIGTGMKPLSLVADKALRATMHALWLRWTDESDARGELDWYGQQAQITRCWLEAGECFVRLRRRLPGDGLTVPLQVEVLEPEMCPYLYNTRAANGNDVRAGIEYNRIGQRVAYYFYASRPGDLNDWDQGTLRRIPAAGVLHVFKPVRAGQIRGIPHLTRALIRLRELDKFDDATLLRQQLSAMFVAFLKHPVSDSSSLIPITGQEPVDTEGDRPVLSLRPGIFQELEPGEEVDFSEPPDLMSGYMDFVRQQLFAVSAATGVPYEVLTGDMSAVNDRTVRVILHEFRRQIQADQHQTVAFQLCRPVWAAWMDAAYEVGGLPLPVDYLTDPTPWRAVKWMPQGWPYLHPVQDVEAAKQAIRSGFTSRSDVVSQQGEDAEVIDAQQAADNERADALDLPYDSDARQSAKGSAAPTPSEPEQPAPNSRGGGRRS